MFIHCNKLFKIYFGDLQDKIYKDNLVNLAKEKNICELENFANLKKNIKFETLVFLNQVHGANGLLIESIKQAQEIKNFTVDGDFLVTNISGVAICVLTADCLPIVFVDGVNKVVAVAHAGWRGSVDKIACKAIECMQKKFGTKTQDLQVFFGPCIKSCCYKVGDNFIDNLAGFEFARDFLQEKSDGLYFDLTMLNAFLLLHLGVKRENISLDYNLCTCCDKNFFSYRRGDKEGRQMTVVCLE